MNSIETAEIKNKILQLPVLEKKLAGLISLIRDEETKLSELLEKYKEESKDVEDLYKDSFSVSILKFIGKYDGKISKENQEMLEAKLMLDKCDERIKALKADKDELESRVNLLKNDEAQFKAELQSRELKIKSNINTELYLKYEHYDSEQEELSRKIIEINEAVAAARRVEGSAAEAIRHLKSAEDWATYDVWTRGGIFSHLAKYEHIDSAKSAFNKLNFQINILNKELADICLTAELNLDGIDSTTRAVDFWLDNIFTDLNVRDRIRGDADRMYTIQNYVHRLIAKLENDKQDAKGQIENIENMKKELLISFE